MHGKMAVESMIHMLPVPLLYVMCVAGVLEIFLPHNFAPSMVRMYGLLMLGTWFFHVAYILYEPFPLPGQYRKRSFEHVDRTSNDAS
jgi:Family of unknown function (DUF716)